MNLRPLTDEQILSDTKRLTMKEREILIQVLHHLLEVNRRKLFSPKFRSLFEYATVELGYSADQTSTREEKLEVLKAIEGKSTRETTRELIKRSTQPERMRTETIRPVSSTVNEVCLYLKDEVIEKILKIKGRLAHKHSNLSNSELFEILLELALAETDPGKEPKRNSKKAITEISAAPRRRYPGAALKRHVFREAQGRCVKCGSIHALEFDHKTPFALGGLTIAENLRLLCRNCNQRESVKVFG